MSSFEVFRTTHVDADPARVHGLLNDFHEWSTWSPWEGIDPAMQRAYSGPDSGVGAHYAWSGNRKAGEGSMEITESTPERVALTLTFLKPWKAANVVWFELTPSGSGTDVRWVMTGENTGLMAIIGKVIPMDKMVGRDFEKGLAQLKAAAEGA